jgi:hypothetical protein
MGPVQSLAIPGKVRQRKAILGNFQQIPAIPSKLRQSIPGR